jgi:hypothetical protein
MKRWLRLALLGVLLAALTSGTVGAQSGATGWSEPIDLTQPSRNQHGEFPKLLCDRYNNTHALFGSLPTIDSPSEIYYRTDAGGVWSAPIDVLSVPERVAVRFDAVISPQTNVLHLIWVSAWIDGELRYSQAPLAQAADPRAWSPPTTLASHISNANNTGNATLAVDQNGVIHLVYGTYDETGTQLAVQHMQTTDDGLTWSTPVTLYSTVASQPSDIGARVAVDGQGRLHVAITIRTQEYGLASELGYVRSNDAGQTWGQYQLISNVPSSFQGLSTLAVYTFGDDEVHLTWHDPRRLHQWSYDGGQTWQGPVSMIDLGAAFGGPNALAKDSAGVLHMVAATGDGVYTATFDGQQWGVPERIDNRPNDPHGQDIVVCQGNRLHVAYYDRTGDGRVWYFTRSVNTPRVERQPIPVPTPLPTPSVNALGAPGSTRETNITPVGEQVELSQRAPEREDPFTPFVIPIVAAVVLIALVFVVQFRKSLR